MSYTGLTDQQLKAKLRAARRHVGLAKKTLAATRKNTAIARAVVADREITVQDLRLEDERRLDERIKESREAHEKERNFERQLEQIGHVILKYFPEELQRLSSIPLAVEAIIERFAYRPRAMPSLDSQHPDQPKQ